MRSYTTSCNAQGGHREYELSDNNVNFLEILELLSSHDEIISKRVIAGPRNANAGRTIKIANLILGEMGRGTESIGATAYSNSHLHVRRKSHITLMR